MNDNYVIPAAIRGRYSDGGGIIQQLEFRPDCCINTLTTVQKDNVLVICPAERDKQMGNNSVYVGNVNPSGRGMNGAVYDASGVSPTLTTNKGEGIKVRTLSPPIEL